MATIGLLDWDLTYWQQPSVFNLELMKLATYHKQKRNIIKMLNEYDQERYSKIIVRKDYDDDDYPTNIFNNPKSECGGLAFSHGIYKPMDINIETSKPDTSIYEKMGRYYQYDEASRYRFNSMIKSPHLRMSLDGKTIWSDWKTQLLDVHPGKTFNWIIHDKNISQITDAPREINSVLQHFHSQGRRLGFKYPIDIYNIDSFLNWGKLRKLKHMSNMRLHFFIPDNCFIEAINTGGHLECEYILDKELISPYYLTQIYKQAIFLGEHHSKILLTLREENLVSQELKQTLQLINEFIEYIYKTHKKITLYEYAKRYCKWLKIDLLNTFDYIRLNNYPLFKLFYECLSIEIYDNHFESRFVWTANGGTIYDKR